MGRFCRRGPGLVGGISAAALLAAVGPTAYGQYSIPDNNGVVVGFDIQPTAAEFGSGSITGGGGDIADEPTMDVAVNAVSAASASTALPPTATNPPANANALWRYNSSAI